MKSRYARAAEATAKKQAENEHRRRVRVAVDERVRRDEAEKEAAMSKAKEESPVEEAAGETEQAERHDLDEYFVPDAERTPILSDSLTARHLTELTDEYDRSLDDEERLSALAKEAKKKRERLEQRLWDEIGEAGQDSFKRTKDGVSFIRKETLYSKVVDADALMAYIEQHQLHDDLLVTDFRKKRLNAIVANSIKEETALPPGLDFSATRYITRAQGKQKSYVPDQKVEGSHGEDVEI